ncbi:Uma2 family endonuclease, partial [Pseudomonas syringae]|uniref:Uma2 family endonuclease n=1 Tax=Pseudomonas syringae TaxID=317 RepID=UPI0034D97051
MVALQKKIWTVEEYLAFERDSQERHDFVNGEIFMMTGASENHNLIVANTIIALGIQLRGRPCKL